MLTAILFVIGLLVGIAAGYAVRRPAPVAVAAPRTPVARPVRDDSITPMSVLLGEDTREQRAIADARFTALASGVLNDVVAQHDAAGAAVWRLRDGVLIREMSAGNLAAIDDMEPALLPLLTWSAREGVVHLGPDGDAPRAVVAPLGVRNERPTGAVAILFNEPFAGDRSAVKQWLMRHAERVELIAELVRTHEELSKTNRRTRVLLRETQSWDVEERPDDLGARLCAMIEQLTGADGAALVRWDENEQRGIVAVADGTCTRYAGSSVEEDSLAGAACRENVPQLWHEVSRRGEGPEALFSRALPTQSGCVLVQPLRRRATVIGAVVATHQEAGALGPPELRALSLFDAVASFRLASAWKLEEVTRRALVDGLTGLTNRVGFEAEMHTSLGEQMRFGWDVSLVIVDVDHFKAVNDTHGHEVGDAVLRAIAETLDDGLRTTDVCARVGGEEMALILKDTGSEGANELAERLRVAVESLRVPHGGTDIRVTASFGVATYPSEVPEWSALYRMADRALYEAKRSGRNQVRSVSQKS